MLIRPVFSAAPQRRSLYGCARKLVPLRVSRRNSMTAPRPMADRKNDSVWKLQNIETEYWHEYIATRPKYDATIFDPIFDYHTANGTPFHDVIDIGTGAGSALGRLINRFPHVTASDNDTLSLGFAQERHRDVPANRLTWTLSKGEDLTQHHPPSSFDMATCALTFPLLDTEKALRCMFTLLRPGGTLAIWFYGPPIFTDPALAEKAQPALYAAVDHAFKPVVSGGDPQRTASWKRAADGMASWLDYIPFQKDDWQDVRRHKWNNANARLAFFGPAACDFDVEPLSAVTGHEAVTEVQDPSFWKVDWDVEMVKRFVMAVFPKPKEMVGTDAVMEGYFEKLRDIMGGPGKKTTMSWPAVLILAQRSG
ncbi:S-adenosyl-L-methionine-dependent methyltransferase [Lojkania enalia]|uniref:S-adenosyl-L-methionine-dependent methyltransferase n=1 Tax=Lojkania enalia TaxID=147567 RepID=A0A9P4K0D1_9PLEO|nr:S-adenosyl-L-methionine-dependent methyltransferase [Didymosphaeria enalia]